MKNEDPNPAFICSITSEIFKDPVIAEDGHTYERSAIEDWFKKNSTSPNTGLLLANKNLLPNRVIISMINDFYHYEEKAKKLENENTIFFNKFASEINKIPNSDSLKGSEHNNDEHKK